MWFDNPKAIDPDQIYYEKCVGYRFCRVSFGLTVLPFLLNATIREHLKMFDHPIAQIIEDNLYVDNILIDVGSVQKAWPMKMLEICQQAKARQAE
jgi:hypothetical protein